MAPDSPLQPSSIQIPKTQTVALVRSLGGPVEFVSDYPVPTPGQDEVLAKVLYSGVCQSDLHTRLGTACGPDGRPITAIKLPHIGGHDGIGRIVSLGPGLAHRDPSIRVGGLVGIRFASRVCRRCEYCLAGTEQYCTNATNHLHHEDGAFQEWVVLDAGYLTVLPEVEGEEMLAALGPTLCAGVTAFKAVKNAEVQAGQWVVVVGAGGGLGLFAVQFAKVRGARVVGVDTGAEKKKAVEAAGAVFVDFRETEDLVGEVRKMTGAGAHAVVVTAGNSKAYAAAADMLRTGGTLAACGIPPDGGRLETTMAAVAIKGLKIIGNLVGSLKECLDA
ncbi:alcohol dehydrogenase-like protein 1 [Elsinoe australis]|uniref:Alcohol dehydrogenase-like protein 1 n=1 Tax=Elsinoe australis TaxID=40998 RepID=A0A4U7BDP3_9PEZI|nr:alcohol dehydrogenase-like protein 1 [Elsinoe australis]